MASMEAIPAKSADQGPTLGVAEFEALVEATRAIAESLDVEAVLRLIVESVRNLVHAEYAALGIVDSAGHIERFITVGVDPKVRAMIGSPPRGHGLLGLIVTASD